MSYKIALENELEGDIGGYGCAVCGAVTETEAEEYHAPNCHILEARKKAFSEVAEMIEDLDINYQMPIAEIVRHIKASK
jgi:CRISPR/Cas system-associated protein Cas10 (large subunit of type III CRISPR-Cas system)